MWSACSRRTGTARYGRSWIAAAIALFVSSPQASATVDIVSRATDGKAGNAASRGVALNRDGSVVAFYSGASNLVPSDTGTRDVFVWDAGAGVLERVSVAADGSPADRPSHAAGGPPALDGDGGVVAYYSDARNLVAGDDNGQTDVFVRVRDRGTGAVTATTEIISVSSLGDLGNGPSLFPSISADGRFVAFQSLASNLIADDANGAADIFVHDRESGTTERVCDAVEPNAFSFAPALSADGDFIAFASAASNLVDGDTNGVIDIFVCSRNRSDGTFANGALERVSLPHAGGEANADSIVPAISGSGCFVAFKSEADNLVADDRNEAVDVFVRVRGADVTEVISARSPFAGTLSDGSTANDGSFPPSISWDGRFVAFGSFATNLLVGDVNQFSSVYVRDRADGAIRLVDVNDAGIQADAGTPDAPPSVSGDGDRIGFVSAAGNLAPPGVDTNFAHDVFRADNPFDSTTIENVCCDCADDTCAAPENGICPTGCVPVCDAVCTDPGVPGVTCREPTATATATITATPTVTATMLATATASSTPVPATATPSPDATSTRTATVDGGTATPTAAAATPSATPSAPSMTPATATRTPNGSTATPTAGSPTPGGGTATPTAAETPTPTPEILLLDDDSCAIRGPSRRSPRLAWILLPAAAALLVRRRR